MVDAPLEDVAPSPIPLNSEAGSTITDKIPNLADTTTATAAGSMFETMDAVSSASESDSDDADPDINKINETWANLMLELDTMKMAAGMSKGKGKKGKGHQVVLETPDMVKLKNKISKVEKEYLFSRKDGGEDRLCIANTCRLAPQDFEVTTRHARAGDKTKVVQCVK